MAPIDQEDSGSKTTPKRRPRKASSNPENDQPLSAGSYAIVALVSGLIGIGLLVFYVREVPALAQSENENKTFYILLFPWALACSSFLFGTMRSYARYSHKKLGSALEVSGPAVLFFLVLIGGFKLVPQPPEFFDLTVRAHSADGVDPVITSGSPDNPLFRAVGGPNRTGATQTAVEEPR